MRSIYLIRHGALLLDTDKKCCIGQSEYEISLIGEREMEAIKLYLERENIVRIFHSPLIRCRKSAEIVSGWKIPCVIVDGLKEINMGDWEGMTFEEIRLKYPKEYEQRGMNFSKFVPPNGESFSMCHDRAKRAFQQIIGDTCGNIAILAHAGTNRMLICWLKNIDLNHMFSIPQPYGCVNIINENNGLLSIDKIGFLPSY